MLTCAAAKNVVISQSSRFPRSVSLRALLIATAIIAVFVAVYVDSYGPVWSVHYCVDMAGPRHLPAVLDSDRPAYLVAGEGDRGSKARCWILIRGSYKEINRLAMPLVHYRQDTWRINGRAVHMPRDKVTFAFADFGKEGFLIRLAPEEVGAWVYQGSRLTPQESEALFNRLQLMRKDPDLSHRFVSLGRFADLAHRY